MQFYKWGDAIPWNALCELGALKRILQNLDGRLPVFLLDEMLREQLGAAYKQLPQSFPVGCYLFLLQRAQEEETMFKKLRYAGLRKKERPDYQYGFQIGYAQVRHKVPLQEYPMASIPHTTHHGCGHGIHCRRLSSPFRHQLYLPFFYIRA
jgi:hypothetical protein